MFGWPNCVQLFFDSVPRRWVGDSGGHVKGTYVPNESVSKWTLIVDPTTPGSPVYVAFGKCGNYVQRGNAVPNLRVSSYSYNVETGHLFPLSQSV